MTSALKTVHGWAFPRADEFMAAAIRKDGSYQRANLDRALEHVTDWSCAIDGGAHVGTWTRLLAQRFKKVIAVEPSQDTFDALIANIRSFGLTNVVALRVALGAEPGFVTMAPLDPRHAALKNTGARYVQPGTDIPRQRIDDLVVTSCGFLKLDIEGSEPLALAGARQMIRRCHPIVLFESKNLWKRYGKGKPTPHDILRDLGYRHRDTVSHDEIWGPA